MNEHGGLATQTAIAAVVTSTDELSAQRTRQAKVVDAARARSGVSTVDTNVAPTRSLRGEKTTVDRKRWDTTTRVLLSLTALAIVAAIAVLVHVIRTPKGAAIHPAETPIAAPPIMATDAAIAEAPIDAAAPVEVEMPPDNARVPKKPGTISIDSTPFATIYIDGKRVDVTPLLNRSLPAGRHKIRAVLADGRAKDFSVEIPAGKAAKPITLTW
jgi:hypothetical protein